MTLEQKRAEILKRRLDLLNEYLVNEAGYNTEATGESFAEYLKNKGVSYAWFVKDLPPGIDTPPAYGYDNIMAYANSLNQILVNQMLTAMGNGDLPEQYINDGEEDEVVVTDKLLSCSGCANEDSCGKNNGGDWDNSWKNESKYLGAEGGCGLPPVPPPFPKVKAIKKSVEAWDKYNAKKKKYQDCRKNQKGSGQHLALHLLHLSNPMEAVGRKAFLDLVAWNVFGMASIFEQMKSYSNQAFWTKIKNRWYDFGGDPAKLDKSVDKGKNKKPIFRKKGWKPKAKSADGFYMYDGGAAEVAGAIAAAATIIAAIVPVIKEFRKSKGEPDVDIETGPDGNQNQIDLPDGALDGGQQGLSSKMKWIIGLSIGVPVLGISIWGIYKLATK